MTNAPKRSKKKRGDRIVGFQCSQELLKLIDMEAKATGMSRSDVLRRLALDHYRGKFPVGV